MRIFSYLALIIVLAIVMFQYSNNIQGTAKSESGAMKTDAVKKQLDDTVSAYQKSLDDALKQSGAN